MAAPVLPIAGLPLTVCGIMIDQALSDSSHAALEMIANIGLLGSMGGPTMRNMNAAWTLVRRNRAKALYAPGHTANQAASAAAGPPPGARAAPATDPYIGLVPEIIVGGCVTCFRYLCRVQIIAPGGYSPNQRSYLSLATADRNASDTIALSIIEDLSVADLSSSQCRIFAPVVNQWPEVKSIFMSVAPFERVMKAYIARIQAALPAGGPYPDYSSRVDAHGCWEMGRWIDPETAKSLLAWNINVSFGRSLLWGTIWHRLISTRNPHRVAMFNWIGANAVLGSTPSINTMDRTEHSPALTGEWQPLAVAIFVGDSAAFRSLCTQPGIVINVLGSFGVAAGHGLKTIGVCGATGMHTSPHAEKVTYLLKKWVNLAAHDMEANGHFDRLLDILEQVLIVSAQARRNISGEAVPTGVLARVHQANKTLRRKQVITRALSVIRTIQRLPFRRLTVEVDGSVTVTRMFERPAYHTWFRDFKGRQRAACRDVTELWTALDRQTARVLREGRDPRDTTTEP